MRGKGVTRRQFVRSSAIAAAGLAAGVSAAGAAQPGKGKPLNYNENMEYRRLGKTELMVSAVCLGGHWKRINVMNQDFDENRRDVVSRCIDVGMNYIDACSHGEVLAYSKALKGRRDKMYLAFSDCGREVRNAKYRTKKALLSIFDDLMQKAELEYTDLWRITCHEPGGRHTFDTACELVAALEHAKKQGKARFIGISSHDRRWLKFMIEYFPQLEVIITPYTAKTKALPTDSLFDAIKKADVGFFGIKPFASNSLFKGNSAPGNPDEEEDNKRARLAIRYVLCNPVMTAPIPGLISIQQVDNVAKAVIERRQYDLARGRLPGAHAAQLAQAADESWNRLPGGYQWLRDWEHV